LAVVHILYLPLSYRSLVLYWLQ